MVYRLIDRVFWNCLITTAVLLLVLVISLLYLSSTAQIVINEISPKNGELLPDQSGDYAKNS